MTTELKKFTEAYATTVAAYEPLILCWVSALGIHFIANSVAYRTPKAAASKYDLKTLAAMALNKSLRKPIPPNIKFRYNSTNTSVLIDIHGRRRIPPTSKKLMQLRLLKRFISTVFRAQIPICFTQIAPMSAARVLRVAAVLSLLNKLP